MTKKPNNIAIRTLKLTCDLLSLFWEMDNVVFVCKAEIKMSL